MNKKTLIIVGGAVITLVACDEDNGTVGYAYDPAYGYTYLGYDDAAYDAAAVDSAYYYGGYYGYGYSLVDGGPVEGGIGDAGAAINPVPRVLRRILLRWGVVVDASCVTVTRSSGDNDNDGIDANASMTLNCTKAADGGTAAAMGTVSIQDADDNSPTAGYNITYDNITVKVTRPDGTMFGRTLSGTASILRSQSNANGYDLSRNLTMTGTDTDPSRAIHQTSLTMQSQATFTPDSTQGAVTGGTLTLSGTGTYTVTGGNDASAGVTITRRSDPTVHWNRSCNQPNSTGYDSGAVIYQSSRGNQVRFQYNSCTDVTTTRSAVGGDP